MSGEPRVIDYGPKPTPRRTWGMAWPLWLLVGAFCGSLACLYWRAIGQAGSHQARVTLLALFASITLVALINAVRTFRKAGYPAAGADRGGGILLMRPDVARAPPRPLNGFTLSTA